jgi:hypothetical protein
MRSLIIRFDTDLVLRFEIEHHAIADLWIDQFEKRHAWTMDDDRRFYGLKDPIAERDRAIEDLQRCIDTINSYQPIIDQPLSDLADQDTLNYLHSIFENYHGLLDQQRTVWWKSAPDTVKKALANLNIAVHRMESAQENLPRIVCTWFGMPKDRTLDPDLMRRHGRLVTEWGGVYLNYVEIGKTLEDLARDDDRYIGDDAFQPFRHYSADFNVRFYDRMASVAAVYRYWEHHRDFFAARGIHTWDDPAAFPYRFKIAQLQTDFDRRSVLAQLAEANKIMDTYLE